MATINLSAGTGVRGWEGSHKNGAYVLYNRIDFSVNNGGSADVIQAIIVPANHEVVRVAHLVVTPEGGTSTCTVGDAAAAAGYIASANNNATANTLVSSDPRPVLSEGTPNTFASFTNTLTVGKFYAAQDTIDITLSANAVDTAVILLSALVIDWSKVLAA